MLLALGSACGGGSSTVTTDQQAGTDQALSETAAPDTAGDQALSETAAPDADLADPDLADVTSTDTTIAVDTADSQDAIVQADPPKLFLTVNRIPKTMNGSENYVDGKIDTPYRYTLPQHGFTFELMALDGAKNAPLDPATLSFACYVGDGVDKQPLTLCNQFSALFQLQSDGVLSAKVPSECQFPITTDKPIACDASVKDMLGQESGTLSYRFDVKAMTPELHPFDTQDVWLIVTSRNNWTISLPEDKGDGTYKITAVAGANTCEPNSTECEDLNEDMTAMGLRSTAHPQISAFVRKLLLETVRQQMYSYFHLGTDGAVLSDDSVNIKIYFEGDPDAPPKTATDVSKMGVGGWDGGTPDTPNNGRANIDGNNKAINDNSSAGLGVFTTSMFNAALNHPIGAGILKQFLPGIGNASLGMHPKDALIWTESFDPENTDDQEAKTRYAQLKLLIDIGALAISSVAVHEMGHSLGLVPVGPPPGGLFGCAGKTSFTDSAVDSAHIDTPGLNLMQQGGDLDPAAVLAGQLPFFNEVNLAYLRGRLLVISPTFNCPK